MSLVDALILPALSREAGHSSAAATTTTTMAAATRGQLLTRPRSQAIEKKAFGFLTKTTEEATTSRPCRASLPAPTTSRQRSPDVCKPVILDTIHDNHDNMAAQAQKHQLQKHNHHHPQIPLDLCIDTNVPPALPARSALRSSHLLASPLDLSPHLDAAVAAMTMTKLSPVQPPRHEVYLSSEEDASSSADDFSEYDSDAAEPEIVVAQKMPMQRQRSHEDNINNSNNKTAKLVSVVYAGRPSVVTLSPSRATFGASGSESPPSPPSGIRPLERAATDSSLCSAMSTATTSRPMSITPSSASPASASSFRHPPRSSSMYMAPPPTPSGINRRPPTFLSIDPFADVASIREHDGEAVESTDSPALRTPMTPSAMLRRGLNLVRKRSRPLLSPFGGPEPTPASASTSALMLPPTPTFMPGSLPTPTLHIQTAGLAVERARTPTEQTLMSAVPMLALAPAPYAYPPGYDLLNKPVRKVSTPVMTPISPLPTTPSPARNRGRLLGFRRQSLSLKGAP